MLVKLNHFIAPEGKDFFADEQRVTDFKNLIIAKFGSAEAVAAGQVYGGIQVTPAKITRVDVFTNGLPEFNNNQISSTTVFRDKLEADGWTIVSDETEVASVADVAKLGDFVELVIENGVLVTEIKPAA